MSGFRRMMMANAAFDPLKVPLTFTAETDGSKVVISKNVGRYTIDDINSSGLHYRLGTSGAWIPFDPKNEDLTVTLNTGESMQLWNSETTLNYEEGCCIIAGSGCTGKLALSGNIQSLINFYPECTPGCFAGFFQSNSAITSVPLMPATILADRCYQSTYYGCKGLSDISYLTLPATNGAAMCYFSMFNYSGVTKPPRMKLTTIADQSLKYMFRVSRLTEIEVDFSAWGTDSDDTYQWLYGVNSSGVFTKPDALPENRGGHYIPSGWTVVNK